MTAEPSRRLDSMARFVWRGEQVAVWGLASIAGLAFGGQLDGALSVLARAVPLAGLVVCTLVVPELRWRRWRWEVREDEIDIRHGTLTVRRTLIPMPRVQHVDTTRGVVEQSLNLATVEVHTAAGSHKIPLLGLSDADEVRDRISQLARTDEF
jgi:membrane protein YdbS with pleckstrin-like domain